jgi:hypothetical protein
MNESNTTTTATIELTRDNKHGQHATTSNSNTSYRVEQLVTNKELA